MFAIDPFHISCDFVLSSPSAVGFFCRKKKDGNCELRQVIMYLFEFLINLI